MELEKSREVWKKRVGAWRESGLSQSEYCRRHGLKREQFWRWRRRVEPIMSQVREFVEVTPPAPTAGIRVSIDPSGEIRIELDGSWSRR